MLRSIAPIRTIKPAKRISWRGSAVAIQEELHIRPRSPGVAVPRSVYRFVRRRYTGCTRAARTHGHPGSGGVTYRCTLSNLASGYQPWDRIPVFKTLNRNLTAARHKILNSLPNGWTGTFLLNLRLYIPKLDVHVQKGRWQRIPFCQRPHW